MLKTLDPLLNADLLHVLRAMGHGDELVLCDANFPAASIALHTATAKLIRLDGVGIRRAARAILSVLPLDTFVDQPVLRMEVVGQADEIPPVQQEMQAEIDLAEGRSWPMGSVERFAFYERAKSGFAVVATGEERGYGCFLLKKGVILAAP
ncbi:MAG TPA: RbsD/FucU family protein [Alphaproteobacteria bacterium]|nr:RbsD/FucU family protein [Alphaproteobacteria bacterium]